MILRSASDYRSFNKGVYGLEFPIVKPWTSTVQILDIASEFFEATTKLVESPSTAAEPSVSRKYAKSQMADLADTLFWAFREQIEWLSSPRAMSETGNERKRDDLEDRFRQARPVILDALRKQLFRKALHSS
jgi:nuclear pore complex protein Nup133